MVGIEGFGEAGHDYDKPGQPGGQIRKATGPYLRKWDGCGSGNGLFGPCCSVRTEARRAIAIIAATLLIATMVLNFGGANLFSTYDEERYKGVFENRIAEIPSADASAASYGNLDAGAWEDMGVSTTIEVNPDQVVVVLATGVAKNDNNDNLVEMRVLRDNATQIGEAVTAGSISGANKIAAGFSIMSLDSPGEGIHTYKLQGMSDSGSEDIWDAQLVTFVIAVK